VDGSSHGDLPATKFESTTNVALFNADGGAPRKAATNSTTTNALAVNVEAPTTDTVDGDSPTTGTVDADAPKTAVVARGVIQ